MKKYTIHIILFSLLVLMLALIELFKPVKHSWIPTLINSDKDPYGAYILYKELPSIFPGSKIVQSRVPVDELELKDTSGNNLVIILSEMSADSLEAEAILDFAINGNSVFIAAERFNPAFLKPFGLNFSFKSNQYKAKDSALVFCNSEINFPEFSTPGIGNPCLGVTDSQLLVTAIIRNKAGDNKMIKIDYGEGEVFFCTTPLLFTNYSLLEPQGKAAAIALSYLSSGKLLIWDEYYKQSRDEIQSPIRYILKNRSTYWAYILTLTGLLLFLLFQLKRHRSMVPVVEPFKNTSLEFLQAVALLHYEQRNYTDIARKKASFFLELLRTGMHVSTTALDQDFATMLSARTAYSKEETIKLIGLIDKVAKQKVDRETLIELNKKIEDFIQKTGIKI
jgi:hypothetical protein